MKAGGIVIYLKYWNIASKIQIKTSLVFTDKRKRGLTNRFL